MKPVREPITESGWKVIPPAGGTYTPLLLRFARSLDWALLRQAVTVTTRCGQVVDGCVEIGMCERELAFRPTTPWAAKPHQVSIAAELEDVCGNSFVAAFDRPLRNREMPTVVTQPLVFPFDPL